MASLRHLRLGAVVYHRDNNLAYGPGIVKYVRKRGERDQHNKRTQKRYCVEWLKRAPFWDMSFHTAEELLPIEPPPHAPIRRTRKRRKLQKSR